MPKCIPHNRPEGVLEPTWAQFDVKNIPRNYVHTFGYCLDLLLEGLLLDFLAFLLFRFLYCGVSDEVNNSNNNIRQEDTNNVAENGPNRVENGSKCVVKGTPGTIVGCI